MNTASINLSFGVGLTMVLYGVTLYYKSFFEESMFENPLVPMSVSFVAISMGLSLLFGVFV